VSNALECIEKDKHTNPNPKKHFAKLHSSCSTRCLSVTE